MYLINRHYVTCGLPVIYQAEPVRRSQKLGGHRRPFIEAGWYRDLSNEFLRQLWLDSSGYEGPDEAHTRTTTRQYSLALGRRHISWALRCTPILGHAVQ